MPIVTISDINNIQTVEDVITFTKSMILENFLNKVQYSDGKWYVLNDDGYWIESQSTDYIKIMCERIQNMVICEIIKSKIPRTKNNYDIFNVLTMNFFVNTVRDECEHFFYI